MSRSRAYTRHQRERSWKRMWRIVTERWRHVPNDLAVYITNQRYQHRRSCSCFICQGMYPYERQRAADWSED